MFAYNKKFINMVIENNLMINEKKTIRLDRQLCKTSSKIIIYWNNQCKREGFLVKKIRAFF